MSSDGEFMWKGSVCDFCGHLIKDIPPKYVDEDHTVVCLACFILVQYSVRKAAEREGKSRSDACVHLIRMLGLDCSSETVAKTT